MLLRLLLRPLRRRHPPGSPPPASPQLTPEQYETLLPVATLREGSVDVTYCTPNPATRWRVDTLFTKEPDTIEWIRGFETGDILLDIGANVGMYAIFAAKTRGTRVYAFEPEAQNFALLYKNIVLNAVADRVTGYCAALSDEETFSMLYLGDTQAGGACHTFGADLDPHLRVRESARMQGCCSTTLDKLVQRGVLPVPTHVKVDVDGLEHKVLDGCRDTLANPRLKSVLVELNTNLAEHRRIVEDMKALGFSFSAAQVESAMRREGPFKGVGNHVFRR